MPTNKFKITLPEREHNPQDSEKKIKAMFKEDADRGGLLARALVFLYMKQPCSTTDLKDMISNYYGVDYDRTAVYRALRKLIDKHLVASTTTGIILHLSEAERSEVHHEITKKYFEFLNKIPEQFRKRFQNINYFWVANGEGVKYIDWCCKVLNFKCEKIK